MKKIIVILIVVIAISNNLYCQYANPIISMIVSPWIVSLNGTTTLEIMAGNSANSTIAVNSLRIEIAVGTNVEIVGFSTSATSDSRWTLDSQTVGVGNTVVLTNSLGGFGSFDLGNIYLSLVGRVPSEPIDITGNIGYIPGNNPALGGALNSSQGNAIVADDSTQTSVSVTYYLEDCINGIDDDADGFIDCSDADCSLSGLDTISSLSISLSDILICPGDSVILHPYITNLPANHPTIAYSWWVTRSNPSSTALIFEYDLTVYNSGNYNFVASNSMGCSLHSDTITITVTDIDPTVTQTNSTLTAAMPDAEYQWIDCNTAASPIAGATGQVFNPTQNGSYAVVVTKNGCSETSNCSIVNTVGAASIEKENGVTIYPNPFADELYLTFEKEQTDTKVNIFGMDGKLVLSNTVSGSKAVIETQHLPKGMCFVQLIGANEATVFKMIKY